MGSIAGRGGQIPHASSQKKNPEYKQQKQHCNKFNKDLKKKKNTRKQGQWITKEVSVGEVDTPSSQGS